MMINFICWSPYDRRPVFIKKSAVSLLCVLLSICQQANIEHPKNWCVSYKKKIILTEK